jgi:transketolase
MNNQHLLSVAKKLRQDTFLAFLEHGEAHIGGSFSIIETLVALYEVMLSKNDKFILSKAHASFPLCLILRRYGFNPPLKTHLELDVANGIHCTTGSLGHGLPMAVGMALARKLKNMPGKVYVLISDGECQEGTTWESLLIASKHKLSNLVLLIDSNKIQALSRVDEVLPLGNIAEKLRAFGFNCMVDGVNGHNFDELIFQLAKKSENDLPSAVVLNTIKGKGLSFCENDPSWHARKIRGEFIALGKAELGIS